MTTTPTLPPQPWFEIIKDVAGNLTVKTSEPYRRHYEALWRQAGSPDNAITSNVNSGVALAQAQAAAAQAAADAAAAQAANVGSESGALSASVSPPSRLKTRLGAGPITSSAFTAIPANGTGPFTYLWSVASGDAVTITDPTSASTTVSASLTVGQELITQLQCVITDSLAATATGNAANTFIELS